MGDAERVTVLKFGLATGLFVLLGAGCVTVLNQATSSQGSSDQWTTAIEDMRGCIKGKKSYEDLKKIFATSNFHPQDQLSFNEVVDPALKKKFSEGWQPEIFCAQAMQWGSPSVFFSLTRPMLADANRPGAVLLGYWIRGDGEITYSKQLALPKFDNLSMQPLTAFRSGEALFFNPQTGDVAPPPPTGKDLGLYVIHACLPYETARATLSLPWNWGDFEQVVQGKLNDGWKFDSFCVKKESVRRDEDGHRKFAAYIVYFSMHRESGDPLDPSSTAIFLPRLADHDTKHYAPNLIGFWRTAADDLRVHFSEVVGINGYGDVGTMRVALEGSGKDVRSYAINADTGGGDGPFGWTATLKYRPYHGTTQVTSYKEF